MKWAGLVARTVLPACSRGSDAILLRTGYSGDPSHTGGTVANNK